MTPRNTYAIGLQPCESMVCKFPPTQSENVGLGERNQRLLELRPLDHLQRICGTNGCPDPGATIRQLLRRKSMRYHTIKTTFSERNGRRGRFVGPVSPMAGYKKASVARSIPRRVNRSTADRRWNTAPRLSQHYASPVQSARRRHAGSAAFSQE